MTNPPRVHHFIPQFWIKKFVAVDGKLWAYDWKDDCISERSSKQLMQVFNLYTVQPLGIDDTTLETIDNNKIDNDGSLIFDRVLNGDRSQEAKEELARFLAAQVMRDPEVVMSYNERAQELTLSLLDAFDAPDYPTFLSRWTALYPTVPPTEAEYNYIKSLGLRTAESALEKIIVALDSTEALPELPFTDVVRNPDGRRVVSDHLLACDWTLKTTTNGDFILGDAGVLYEAGAMESLRAPLSNKTALFLTSAKSQRAGIDVVPASVHDVMNLNIESASRSRRWIVGEPSSLHILKAQVARKSFLA